MLVTKSEMGVIDDEWLSLMIEAKELGLSVEYVRDFLKRNKENELLTKNS